MNQYKDMDICTANEHWENQDGPWEERPCECDGCKKVFPWSRMTFTRDCHGVPFHLMCILCYERAMEKGYDGEYYDEPD